MDSQEALKIVNELAVDAFRHRLIGGEHGDSPERIADMANAIAEVQKAFVWKPIVPKNRHRGGR